MGFPNAQFKLQVGESVTNSEPAKSGLECSSSGNRKRFSLQKPSSEHPVCFASPKPKRFKQISHRGIRFTAMPLHILRDLHLRSDPKAINFREDDPGSFLVGYLFPGADLHAKSFVLNRGNYCFAFNCALENVADS
jgi:hypothetical protein